MERRCKATAKVIQENKKHREEPVYPYAPIHTQRGEGRVDDDNNSTAVSVREYSAF